MRRCRLNAVLCSLLLLLLAGCGAGSTPAAKTPVVGIGPLPRIASGELDGQSVTVQAVYYERGTSRLLVPVLSLSGPGGPAPLITSPSQAVLLDRRPEGDFRQTQGTSYGVVRVTGRVAAAEEGRRLELQESKFISPVSVALTALVAGGFESTVVEVEGALLARPDAQLLVSSVGPGGIPESGAAQVKIMAPMVDEGLLGRLQQVGESQARYGPVRVVGFWSGGTLQLLWAEVR